jgi:PIN domain nuclease of toxin-antitoxin system
LTSVAYLADACALVAFFTGSLSPQAITVMREEAVAVSSITVWELTRKSALGKLPPLPLVDGSFSGYLQAAGFIPLPLTWQDAERANMLPSLHKDPMDRMVVAQALRLGTVVITEDSVFAAYGARTLW